MKALFTLVIIVSINLNSRAQTAPSTVLNIFNASGSGRTISFQDNSGHSIVIRSKHWAVIHLNKADSLTLITNKQSVSIPFERGKRYYFLANSDYTPALVVTSKSEQEFLLSVQFNNGEKPEEYSVDK